MHWTEKGKRVEDPAIVQINASHKAGLNSVLKK